MNDELKIANSKIKELKTAINKAIATGCEGRTFYEGYFDVPYAHLSRVDRMVYDLSKAMEQL